MAARKNKKEPNGKFEAGRRAIRALWTDETPREWYTILRKLAPNNRWELKGDTITGRCPYHDDHDPSFVINFERRIGKCFGSCGKVVSDLIQLVSFISGKNYSESLTWLTLELHLEKTLGSDADELANLYNVQAMKRALASATREVIFEYLRDRSPHLSYLRPACVYLQYARAIPLSLLRDLPVGVFAKPEHMRKYIPDELHELYDNYVKAYSKPKFWGAIALHFNDSPTTISRFKLRLLSPDAATDIQKLSSPKDAHPDLLRNLYTKDMLFMADETGSPLGIYGLHHYLRMIGSNTNAYITEGEFDALAVMSAQLRLGREDFMMFAAGGNAGTHLSFLRDLGIRTVWLVQDAPSRHGDEVARAWLVAKENHSGDAINRPLSYKIFCWGAELVGGDLDEAVQLMGYEQVLRYLYTERSAYFLGARAWAEQKCKHDIDHIKARSETRRRELSQSPNQHIVEANVLEDERKDIRDAILHWFQCVHDQLDRLAFIQKFSLSEGIDISTLREVERDVYALDTYEGAKRRLTESIKELIDIPYYENTPKGNVFTLWSKQRREAFTLPATDSGMDTVFSQYLGEDLLEWVQVRLRGSNILLPRPSGNELQDIRQMRQNIMLLMQRVLNTLLSQSRPLCTLRPLGQGIHYADIPEAKSGGYVYFINGALAFKGKFNPSGAPIEWEVLNGMTDEGVVFNLHPGKAWSEIEDTAELYSGTQVDLPAIFKQIRRILDGWKFEHHSIMRDYIAAWILSIPIQRAVGQVNITFLTGESTSGKTSFVRGLLGGMGNTGHDVPPLLEAARFATDATPAWIYQEMSGDSRLLSLDEAEFGQDTEHARRVLEIQTLLYSIPTGGVTTSRGGATMEQRAQYHLRMPVIMAAINMNVDPVFMTRVMVIRTQRDPTRRNIGDYLADLFSDMHFAEIRRSITSCLLHRIPEICVRKATLSKILSETETGVPVSSRFIVSVLTVLTVYEMCGGDPVTLYRNLITCNRSRLEALNCTKHESDLLNAVLYTPCIAAITDDLRDVVSARDLIKTHSVAMLNSSSSGVYYLPDRGWIVLVWRQIRYTVFRYNPRYRMMDDSALFEAAARNAYTLNLSPEEHTELRQELDLTDVKHSQGYTVLDSQYLLNADQQQAAKGQSAESIGQLSNWGRQTDEQDFSL